MTEEKRHPIRVVARRTGLTPDLLRVWEKRYHLVTPVRTKTGRRVYSDADIDRLRLVHHATLSGRRVSEVSTLSNESLEALVREDEREARQAPTLSPPVDPAGDAMEQRERIKTPEHSSDAHVLLIEECMEAIRDLDAPRLEATLSRALMVRGSADFIEGVIGPLMWRVGDLWEKGLLSIDCEHLATGVVRQLIARLLVWPAAAPNAPVIVVTAPAGQIHEIGAILAASAAQAEGWRVVYLGVDVPARDIARASEQVRASAVALSLVYPHNDPKLPGELTELRERLPRGTKVIVGGPAAPSYDQALRRIGAHAVDEIRAFRQILAKIKDERRA